MKFLPQVLLLATLLVSATAAEAQTVPQLLSEAQGAYMRGDMATAKKAFEEVYSLDPKNVTAIGYLRMIKAQERNAPKGNAVEKSLASVVIPKVEFRDATLGAALDYLRQAVPKATDNKQTVNFVVQVPPERLQSQTVTLNLTNVPFTEILKYVGGITDLQFEFDKYAVLVKPKSPTASASPAPLPN